MNFVRQLRVVLLFVALLLMAYRAAADTIVLKNGRRIIALSVVEEGDKVKYQTSAGELSLPKSIVDHIEKGGAAPMAEFAWRRCRESGDRAAGVTTGQRW